MAALNAPLDVLLVRKLGAPGYEEFGIGAVVDGAQPQLVLNAETIAALGVSASYIEAERDRQLAEIERRRQLYTGQGEQGGGSWAIRTKRSYNEPCSS